MLSLRRDDVTTTRTVVRITNFNPRLREGGDHLIQRFSHHYHYFNPRLREGGDVSPGKNAGKRTHNFNPRLREGGDLQGQINCLALYRFQSTPPRRRRPFGVSLGTVHRNFNPRLREGGDIGSNEEYAAYVISIHASAKEATGRRHTRKPTRWISIHASAKEATLIPPEFFVTFCISIHASAKEATPLHLQKRQ